VKYPTLLKTGFTIPNVTGGPKMKASAYEAAGTGRRLGTWGTSAAGPNAAIEYNVKTLRSRSREAIRNNPHAHSAVDAYVSNIVGTGIKPRWKIKDDELREEVQEVWEDSTDEADADGVCDFYGLQDLVARTVISAGSALVRFRSRRTQDGLLVPLQVQVLEPDFLREELSHDLPNGNYIRMGVEYNAIGKRIAYHLHKSHPGDNTAMTNGIGFTRVPASEIMHVFRPMRPGQVQGVPWLSNILVWLHELDQYEDAELVRKKTAAFFSAFVTRPATASTGEPGDSLLWGTDEGADDNDQQILGFEPGTLQYLDEGEDIKFSEPADVGGAYEVWIRRQLQAIAAGIGVTYEQLTGDLSKVNYTSIRAGLLEFRRRCEVLQHNLIVFQFSRPYAIRWLDTAVLAGTVNIPDYLENRRQYLRVDWRPPGWDFVDPLKDGMAQQLHVRNGFKAREDVVSETGYDVEEVDRKQAKDKTRAEKHGLVYDSDPSQTAKSGAIQAAQDQVVKDTMAEDSPPEDETDDIQSQTANL
jgi:lambda family phage portal protein